MAAFWGEEGGERVQAVEGAVKEQRRVVYVVWPLFLMLIAIWGSLMIIGSKLDRIAVILQRMAAK